MAFGALSAGGVRYRTRLPVRSRPLCRGSRTGILPGMDNCSAIAYEVNVYIAVSRCLLRIDDSHLPHLVSEASEAFHVTEIRKKMKQHNE